MTWVQLDDKMPEHPKVVHLSDGAFRLHVSGIAFANRFLTDGLIRGEDVPRLVPRFRKNHLDELLQRELWAEAVAGELFEIHDYLDWNKSRADVEKKRRAESDGGKRGAEKRWGNQ